MRSIIRNGAVLAVAVGLVLALSAGTASAAPAHTRGREAQRAVAAYQALQRYLYVADGSSLYHERYPVQSGDNAYSYEWPFSQAHVATLDLTGMPGGHAFAADLADRARGQERYWHAEGGTTGLPGYDSYARAPYGGGGDMFYDDNEWVGLAKVQQYLMTGDHAALARAKQIFALVESGWDSDATHPDPGGVFWTQATWSHDRNTVSNMPGAELGLRLYQVTHDRAYLDWSLRMYDWTNRYLLSPDGLYWDHVDLEGNVNTVYWSYNQGVPVGVNVLLYKATHDRTYLRRAETVASAAYEYFVTGGRLAEQPIFFDSIFFKNLLLLESVTGGHRYRDAMRAYADSVWQDHRDASTGLVHLDADGSTEAIQQAALVQLYAVLAWPPSRVPVLY